MAEYRALSPAELEALRERIRNPLSRRQGNTTHTAYEPKSQMITGQQHTLGAKPGSADRSPLLKPPPPVDPQPEALPEVYPGKPVPLIWKRMVELCIQNPHISKQELARCVGVNATSIYLWTNKFEYQQYENWVLSKLPPEVEHQREVVKKDAIERVRAKFETYLDDMQDRLFNILETTENEKLQVDIIHDTFDRVGFQKQREAPRMTPIVMTADAMAEFIRRAAECGIDAARPQQAIEGEVLHGVSSPNSHTDQTDQGQGSEENVA